MKQEKVIEVRKLNQKFTYASLQFHEAIARSAGLCGTDHKYLGFLLEKGKLTAGELAALSGLTTGAITGLIDRFEKLKLVKREYDKADRRKVYIVAETERINRLLQPYYAGFQSDTDALIDSFTINEIEIIKSYLQKSIELMQEKLSNLKNTKL